MVVTAIPLYILTCAQRKQQLDSTLTSLAASDWPHAPVIVCDSCAIESRGLTETNPRARGTRAYGHILGLFSASEARLALIVEDDVVFNHYLAHNLALWPVLDWPDFALGNLYNIGFTGMDASVPAGFEPHSKACYGSQALLLTHALACHLLNVWPNYPDLGQDIIIYKEHCIVGRHFVHRPSLVNHVGGQSLVGSHNHVACDFNQSWRARPPKIRGKRR